MMTTFTKKKAVFVELRSHNGTFLRYGMVPKQLCLRNGAVLLSSIPKKKSASSDGDLQDDPRGVWEMRTSDGTLVKPWKDICKNRNDVFSRVKQVKAENLG